MADSHPRYFRTMDEEGNTSANHRPMSARVAVTGAICTPVVPRGLVAADCHDSRATRRRRCAADHAVSAWRLRAGGWRSLARILVRGSTPIAWALEATGRRLGRASTCLIPRARRGTADGRSRRTDDAHDRRRRTAAGAFLAHAWLAHEDRVLVGATSDEYLPMASWTGLPG